MILLQKLICDASHDNEKSLKENGENLKVFFAYGKMLWFLSITLRKQQSLIIIT